MSIGEGDAEIGHEGEEGDDAGDEKPRVLRRREPHAES
jgi:hypothetical protein